MADVEKAMWEGMWSEACDRRKMLGNEAVPGMIEEWVFYSVLNLAAKEFRILIDWDYGETSPFASRQY